MKADAYDLFRVFGFDRQLVAPLFQRPYVWEKDKQWEPLWIDIQFVATKMLANEKDVPPSLGAVVLEQLKVAVGKPDSRLIIDGQQRLTTIQILLAAFRDVCLKSAETEKLAQATENLIFNKDPLVESEEDKYKVLPTNIDRSAFRIVMTEKMPNKIKNLVKDLEEKGRSRILEAHVFFYESITDWIKQDRKTIIKH